MIRNNKVFLYMVIHELKHPTEAIKQRIEFLATKAEEFISEMKY